MIHDNHPGGSKLSNVGQVALLVSANQLPKLTDAYIRPLLAAAEKLYRAGDYAGAIKVLAPLLTNAEAKGVQFKLPRRVLELSFPMPDTYLEVVLKHLPEEIRAMTPEQQIDFVLYFFSLVKQESQYDERAVSVDGATGLSQVMPATGKAVAEDMGLSSYDLDAPEDNLRIGMYYFAKLLNENNQGLSHITLALASYNAGPFRVKALLKERGVFLDNIRGVPETNKFIKRIKYNFEFYAQLYRVRVREALRGLLRPEAAPGAANQPVARPVKPAQPQFYRVIVDRASTKAEALKMKSRLFDLGFSDVWIAPELGGRRYRVQVGAFKNRIFALELRDKLKADFPGAAVVNPD